MFPDCLAGDSFSLILQKPGDQAQITKSGQAPEERSENTSLCIECLQTHTGLFLHSKDVWKIICGNSTSVELFQSEVETLH